MTPSSQLRTSRRPPRGGRGLAPVLALVLAQHLLLPPRGHAQGAASATMAQDAAQALQRGDFEQATILYSGALEDSSVSNDRRAVLLTERGVASMKRRAFKAALDDFNKAATIYPEYAAVYVNRGNLLLTLNQGPDAVKEAIKDFDRAILLSPGLAAAFGNRAAAYFKLRQLDAAVADFTHAIELSPQNPAALNGRGRARLTAGQVHAAVRDFTRAVTINPAFAQSYRNRAEADMLLSLPVDAVEDLSRALAFDARRVDDYVARGRAYIAANNVRAALTDFEKSIELNPRSLEGYIGRGVARAMSDLPDDALADLSRAVELEPRSARAYAFRAWTYIKNQQVELGEKDVERALRLEPVTADAFWAQGELKEAAGDRDAAVAAYSRALGLDLRHRETLQALARLGLEPQREETPVADAGTEGWQVLTSGDQFTATHPQFPALRVALEMLGPGKPKLIAWEPQKAPNASYGLLRYAAGTLVNGQSGAMIECAAVVDLANMVVVGMPVTKLRSNVAAFDWGDNRLSVTGADGLVETIALRQRQDASEAQNAAAKEAGKDRRIDGATASRSQGTSQREASVRHNPQPRKTKTLFDLLFGN